MTDLRRLTASQLRTALIIARRNSNHTQANAVIREQKRRGIKPGVNR